jgi:sulfite reductase beta subunit-like hemoprotein
VAITTQEERVQLVLGGASVINTQHVMAAMARSAGRSERIVSKQSVMVRAPVVSDCNLLVATLGTRGFFQYRGVRQDCRIIVTVDATQNRVRAGCEVLVENVEGRPRRRHIAENGRKVGGFDRNRLVSVEPCSDHRPTLGGAEFSNMRLPVALHAPVIWVIADGLRVGAFDRGKCSDE